MVNEKIKKDFDTLASDGYEIHIIENVITIRNCNNIAQAEIIFIKENDILISSEEEYAWATRIDGIYQSEEILFIEYSGIINGNCIFEDTFTVPHM